jgi:glycosyltransferase 2 family protein
VVERSGMRTKAATIIKYAITAGVLACIVWKLGWREIIATVVQAQPLWLLAALVLFFISGWLGVVQWQIILKNRGVVLPFSRVFSLYFIGMFFQNFALGTITGDAVKVAYIKLGDGKGKAGFAATFLDRFAGLWAMLGYAIFGSVLLIKQKAVESRSMTLAIVALFVTFACFGGALLFLMSKRLQSLAYAVIDRLPWQREALRKILDETIIETHDAHILLPVGVLSTVVQFMRIAVHILCAGALGLLSAANIHYFFIFVPILAMLMVVPLPFGIRESVGGTLFALAGFKVHAAIVMGFLATIVGSAASLVGGVLFVVNKLHLSRKTP